MANHHASASREAVLFHGAFALLATGILIATPKSGFGTWLLILAIAYNVLLPAYALLRGYVDWITRWAFLLPVSIALVMSDWVQVAVTQTLHFPNHGAFRIGGAVPAYMMGLWMLLLFPVTLIADAAGSPRYLLAALLGGLALAAAGWVAGPLALWQPRGGVETLAGIPLYPLPAGMFLCVLALWLYRQTQYEPVPVRLFAALTVPVAYTGALLISLLFLR